MQRAHLVRQITHCSSPFPTSPSILQAFQLSIRARPSSVQVRDSHFLVTRVFPNFKSLDYLQRGHIYLSSACPHSYVRSTKSPLSPSNDDESSHGFRASSRRLFPRHAYNASLFPRAVATRHPPPATRHPSTPPRPQHIRDVSSGSAEDVSDSEDSNGSLPGPSLAMETCDDEDEDEDDYMQDVQQIPQAPSVVDPPLLEHVGLIGSDRIWACGRFDGNRIKPKSMCVPFRRPRSK